MTTRQLVGHGLDPSSNLVDFGKILSKLEKNRIKKKTLSNITKSELQNTNFKPKVSLFQSI
jgi:hypothetical protein